MVGWSQRNDVITSPDSLWRSGLRHKKTFSWWTFICWKKTFLISDHRNHTLTFTLHVSDCQCVYARARIAFVLKLYYLSTIFCQQQHMFAGRRHLTYPKLIGCARHARVRAHHAHVRAYRAWDTYDGVLSAASKRQPSVSSPFYIRQWKLSLQFSTERNLYSNLAATIGRLRKHTKQVWRLTRWTLNMHFTWHVVPMDQSCSLAVSSSHSKQIP